MVDERNLLDVLKFELEFLENGGYGKSPREPWRCPLIFEDSPSCMNYDSKENPAPCLECILMKLVPEDRQNEDIPCRYIPLSPNGETLASLYRWASQQEIEDVMRNWLRATIEKLEKTPIQGATPPPPASAVAQPESSAAPPKGTAISEHIYPKCANPACASAFHWLAGGKFFRFHALGTDASRSSAPPQGSRKVLHYWLCDRCARVYSLSFEEPQGVVVRPLWPELPPAEVLKKINAA